MVGVVEAHLKRHVSSRWDGPNGMSELVERVGCLEDGPCGCSQRAVVLTAVSVGASVRASASGFGWVGWRVGGAGVQGAGCGLPDAHLRGGLEYPAAALVAPLFKHFACVRVGGLAGATVACCPQVVVGAVWGHGCRQSEELS